MGALRAVLGDEQRVVCQPDDHTLPQDPHGGALDGVSSFAIDDLEDRLQCDARRLVLRPAGEELSDRVQEHDPPIGVGDNDCVANAAEGDTTPLGLKLQRVR